MKRVAVASGLVGACVALGVGSLWSFKSLDAETSNRPADIHEVARSQPQLAGVPPVVSRSAEVAVDAMGVGDGSASESYEGAEHLPVDPEQVAFELEEGFEGDEPADHASVLASAQIEKAFRGLAEPGTRLRSLECRLRQCRAVVEFPDSQADIDSFEQLVDDEREGLGGFSVIVPGREELEDGRVVATVFIEL